jgi:putative membrane protein
LKFLTCPLIVVTLGLFTFVINGVLFWITGLVGQLFGIGYSFPLLEDGFWQAFLPVFLGGLVVGIVNTVLTLVFKDELKRRRSPR